MTFEGLPIRGPPILYRNNLVRVDVRKHAFNSVVANSDHAYMYDVFYKALVASYANEKAADNQKPSELLEVDVYLSAYTVLPVASQGCK